MLIHTTRFTDVQGTIKSQVESVFDSIKDQILLNPESKVIKRLERLYKDDFIKLLKDGQKK